MSFFATWLKVRFGGFSFFILFRAFFVIRALLPLAYKKQTLPLVGWSKKYLSVNYSDFLTPTDAETKKCLAADNY
jgi:hypothetical protein